MVAEALNVEVDHRYNGKAYLKVVPDNLESIDMYYEGQLIPRDGDHSVHVAQGHVCLSFGPRGRVRWTFFRPDSPRPHMEFHDETNTIVIDDFRVVFYRAIEYRSVKYVLRL